jgi:hypothetical protein
MITKTRLGTNEDGTPLFHYHSDGHVVLTGPISGTVTTEDGTTYDIGPDLIEVASPQHALEVSDLIGQRHEADGHPLHNDENPFVHTPSALTHNTDGTPSAAFADKVHEHVPAGKDSSPLGVIAALQTKKG